MRLVYILAVYMFLFLSSIQGAKIIEKRPLFLEKQVLIEKKIDTNLISYISNKGYIKCESYLENNLSKIKIIKFDKEGKKDWEQLVDSTVSYEPKFIKSIDEFFLIIGNIKDSNETFILNGHNDNKIFWERRYQVTKLLDNYGIERSKDGFLIYNYTKKGNLWLLKIDLGGNRLWKKEIKGKFSKYKPIVSSYESNFFIATGYHYSKNKHNIKIYKVDSNGTIVWNSKIKNRMKNIIASDIVVSKNSIYLSDFSLSKILESRIYKFDLNGTLLWEKKFPQYKINNITLDEESIIVSGRTNDIKSFTKHLFVAKLNQDGVKLWEDKDRYYKLDFPLEVEKNEDNLTIFGISDYSTINTFNFNESKIIADRNKFKIIDIISEENITKLEEFLEKYQYNLNDIEYKNEKLLYYGLKTNNLNVIKTLYNYKLFTKKGYNSFFFGSPLFQVIKHKKINYDLLEYIVNKNCDINKKDINNKYTPLSYAIKSKRNKLAKFLIDNNASIDLGEEETKPIILSILTKNRFIFDYLVQKGADTNITFSYKLFQKNLNSISPNSLFAYQVPKKIKKSKKQKTLRNINKKYPKVPIEDTFIKIIKDDNKTKIYYVLEDDRNKTKVDLNISEINLTKIDIKEYNLTELNSSNLTKELNITKDLPKIKEIEKYLFKF